ncbi:MAG: hypothetical protein BMS9Abin12_2173 [Acidimicrobiia bacterium]|nr:MAG: hypothetical protein BMS9Abin12_2173 [Acidimicrobiia bacterium]
MTEISELHLLPPVKDLVPGQGSFSFKGETVVAVMADPINDVWPIALRLRETLSHTLGDHIEILAGSSVSVPDVMLRLEQAAPVASHEQGYTLKIEPDRIVVNATSVQGLHHGVSTLIQVVAASGRDLPCLDILDWPDFEVRGVLFDVSRDRVPTMDTLYRMVDELAALKINHLQLYTEHTFAYKSHPDVWAHASPITAEEMVALDSYCRDRNIELVPCQATLGHMHRWLRHPRYAGLAEVEGFDPPRLWGSYPFSLCPVDPGSLDLVRSIYEELLPCFTSPLVNACLDEADDVGSGRSKVACEERGPGEVYLEYVEAVRDEIVSRGGQMLMWADRLAEYPDLIQRLPDDVTPLIWGYIGSDEPFATQAPLFADAGLAFYVCPGTWSFATVAGASDRALANMAGAARHGAAHGARGYLVTDWGWTQWGTIQPLAVSRFWLAVGAAHGWAGSRIDHETLLKGVGRQVLGDSTGGIGLLAYEMGNFYQRFPSGLFNASLLFEALREPERSLRTIGQVSEKTLLEATSELATLSRRIEATDLGPDGEQGRRELQLTIRLLDFACQRLLHTYDHPSSPALEDLRAELDELIEEFAEVWLRRFRPGGLLGTVKRFDGLLSTCDHGEGKGME